MSAIIPDLHLKYAAKTWKETFQLVRRCMDKSRNDSNPCEPLIRSLERLQEVLKVSSMNAMRSRLEVMAKQHGMGFHFTEATCYLTADLFYLEVALLPCGGVEEVKVAPHGASPLSSEALLQLLRSKHFAEFSAKLKDLFTQYNIPGDNDVKFKLFTALQHLAKDLQEMSNLPRLASDDGRCQMDAVNSTMLGCLIAGKDCPLTLQFYSAPMDDTTTNMELALQEAQVAVSSSHVTHKLQMASVLPLPLQLDTQGFPVFTPLSDVPHEEFHACFVLKLQPVIPLMMPFVHKISRITEIAVPDVELQWAPFLQLLADSKEQDYIFTVHLPCEAMHTYVFPVEAWESATQSGAVMDSISFTHPVQIPRLVEVLRHQCVINNLLRSSISKGSVSLCEQHFEIRQEADTSFSVTFRRPDMDSLAVLLVDIPNSHQILCRVFGAGIESSSLDEHVSDVMKRCMSIPPTLQALYKKLEDAASPDHTPEMAEKGPSTPTEDSPATSVPDCPKINSSPTTVSHQPVAPVGVEHV
uniref:mediator of RNA polymerase II transcription subunit 1-like isoform X2 n=1 Tax=Doryrhamphus excisus TaxID=161450 RepID=UPI0025AEBFF7|nr:mediator of RNA polymerase II transcription subunit 1-like isoform X2 [Doryrhamphus excisus]